MIKFDIIVPVYNIENYLPICVDSVLQQTYQAFDLLLVDDGSTDNSASICDEYEKLDKRIKVVHKRNAGLSSARNVGLSIATGTYIVFLDGDDYWDDKNALQCIYERLNQSMADVILFPAKKYYEADNKYVLTQKNAVERDIIVNKDLNKSISYMIKNNIYRAAAWNKIVKKSIIDAHSLRFREGYLSEDMDWCGDLLLYSCSFDYYDNPFYVYRQQRQGSITIGKSEKLISDKLYMCNKGFKQALSLDDDNKTYLLASYYAYEYSVLLGISSGIHNTKLLSSIRNLEPLLEYDMCDKVKKVNVLKRVIGFAKTRKVLCLFVKMKK